jgi:cytochrome c biogenesis protein CcmG/thiol:disulfide interchange protein DsbE
MKPLHILPLVVAVSLGVSAYFALQNKDDSLPSAREGGPVPELTLTKLGDGEPFTREQLMSGEVVLVNFWASWCAPCRVEHEQLKTLSEEGYKLYGVNFKDTPDQALGFLEELGNPFTALAADVNSRTAIDWGVAGVPETFIIDGNGQVVKRFAGPITLSILDSVIRPAIETARAQSN